MLRRFNAMVAKVVEFGLWLGFTALILTVGLQVLARTILKIPLIWTPDLAQLLFSWLIFVGAAIALRRNAHYNVDMLPPSWTRLDAPLALVGFLVAAGVIYLLTVNGTVLAQLRMSGTIQSLGISRGWIFASIPVSGVLMALFSIEALVEMLKGMAGK
ncbi:TRAP transporter small permease [Jiella mangrovi]|uniref:TRAP transporter small permease protein n=1 Tax=Jiella mangrovi TaxID=2821407 RepID=A0ABS4BHA6_9HYPH|nr:TRAP transporter small permease [Jiella mangrovi]MBP0616136.1 TRAP transporter small permease [Jiella mangrovi]